MFKKNDYGYWDDSAKTVTNIPLELTGDKATKYDEEQQAIYAEKVNSNSDFTWCSNDKKWLFKYYGGSHVLSLFKKANKKWILAASTEKKKPLPDEDDDEYNKIKKMNKRRLDLDIDLKKDDENDFNNIINKLCKAVDNGPIFASKAEKAEMAMQDKKQGSSEEELDAETDPNQQNN